MKKYCVTIVYLDSPREDCSGYYEHEIYFDTLSTAISFYYHKREEDAPIEVMRDFDIPFNIRMKHNDVIYEVRQDNSRGKLIGCYNSLYKARKERDIENRINLAFMKRGCNNEEWKKRCYIIMR